MTDASSGLIGTTVRSKIGVPYLNGRMPDSQPMVRIPFAAVSKLGHFRSFSCINGYLAIDSGGNMNE